MSHSISTFRWNMELCISRDCFIHKPRIQTNEKCAVESCSHMCVIMTHGFLTLCTSEGEIQPHICKLNNEYNSFLKYGEEFTCSRNKYLTLDIQLAHIGIEHLTSVELFPKLYQLRISPWIFLFYVVNWSLCYCTSYTMLGRSSAGIWAPLMEQWQFYTSWGSAQTILFSASELQDACSIRWDC